MKVILYSLIASFSISVVAQDGTTRYTKKKPLTEAELQRWSHLDLEKDSIPGMSVDKELPIVCMMIELMKEAKFL
jgi:hypothetical protein